MMSIINNAGLIWLQLHCYFGVLAIAGFILLVIWAAKNLSKGALKLFTIWILVIGIAGSILTAVPALNGIQSVMSALRGGQSMMMQGMMDMNQNAGMMH